MALNVFSKFAKVFPKGLPGWSLTMKRFNGSRTKSILVLNPGSTSLKCSVFNRCDLKSGYSAEPYFKKQIKLTTNNSEKEICDFLQNNLEYFDDIQAIGFRIVHGGDHFKGTLQITNSVVDTLKSIVPLAPLHIPPFLTTLASVCTVFPDRPYYAAFDTSFYTDLEDRAKLYPLPFEMSKRGIVKYGFHGLNHRYCCERLTEKMGDTPIRLITCHLGGGASVSAIKDRVCVDTSMGYTPLDGIMMNTRCGSLDPSIVLQLVKEAKGDTATVERILNRESGIRGISGLKDGGFQEILESDDPRAKLAYEMFLDRLCKTIGTYWGLHGCFIWA